MSKELIEKKNDLITRAEEVLNKAKEEKRELTEEEANEISKIKTDVDNIKRTLDMDEQVRAMSGLKEKIEKEERKVEEKKIEMRAVEVGNEKIEVRADEYAQFENFIRGYEVNERQGEMEKGINGAVIPTTIVNWIIRKVYDICPILERSQHFNVKGNVDVPYYPADANNITVAYANEFTALTSSSGEFGSVQLTGFLAGALTKVSRSLINNAQIDIVGFVVNEMAYAIKRWIEHECLIGTAHKVEGLSTLTNGVTAASATAITADEIIQLHDKIKDDFQQNAIWIMSPATRTALRLLKAETGYYLMNEDVTTPFGTSLLGKPVYVSDNMPNIATGNKVIYYGDMRGLATKFSEDMNIEVLREKFADEHAVGVVGWLEFDAKVVDEQQIAVLTMA